MLISCLSETGNLGLGDKKEELSKKWREGGDGKRREEFIYILKRRGLGRKRKEGRSC
jgi:hypothetical protein